MKTVYLSKPKRPNSMTITEALIYKADVADVNIFASFSTFIG